MFLQCQPPHRKSLSPPPKTNVTWAEYISSEPGKHPNLGRQVACKETSKAYRATVAMVITVSILCPMKFQFSSNVVNVVNLYRVLISLCLLTCC